MSALAAVLALMMMWLAPTRDVPALARAVAVEARSWDEATLAVAVIFREGSNRLNIVGDCDRAGQNCKARCPMQLHNAPREVLHDAGLCVRIGLSRLRASAELCPSQPLAAYAGAPCGSAVAGRISRDRDRVRRRVIAAVLP